MKEYKFVGGIQDGLVRDVPDSWATVQFYLQRDLGSFLGECERHDEFSLSDYAVTYKRAKMKDTGEVVFVPCGQ